MFANETIANLTDQNAKLKEDTIEIEMGLSQHGCAEDSSIMS